MRSLLTRRVRPRANSIGSLLQTASCKRQKCVRSVDISDPAEDSLFSFLEYIQRLYAPETQLRVAGGWVRDKLRGAESEDIDIALDNLMGAKFARHITKFQRDRKLPPSSVGVVKANSDKSKHLEGSTVDLVHLRAEEYTLDSRVPEVKFATPEDDASRRDLTINALFYNLHTRQVEDFTGKGVEDLKAGVIRTPREPVQTFLDDPLRVLRALRFACEFGFLLDPALERAVLDQREIVGAMRRKMLSGNDPARAFEFLRKFNLLELVFNDTAGKMGEGEEYDEYSRLNEISNVESTAAIFTPLFLPKLPEVIPDDHSSLSPPVQNEFDGVTEQEIVESSLEFLDRREAIVAALDSVEIVEMLKVHVKWPKPAGKRVALIIEAIATYPEAQQDLNGSASVDVQYHSVIVPALTILISARSFDSKSADGMTSEDQEAMLKAYLSMAKLYVKGDTVQTKLGPGASSDIARALRVLHVWEHVHPSKSVEDELAFLDRLMPQLRN
ncbi:Poly A polymerase, head domain [Phytophthora cactorum]|nr:Poly A polymerase, head domain [Phytophthora cactorum]